MEVRELLDTLIIAERLNGVWEEKFEDCGSEYLIEHTDFERRYLFPDRNALEAFLERKQLVRWFATLNDTKLKECTLEQLQKAKKLLQNE